MNIKKTFFLIIALFVYSIVSAMEETTDISIIPYIQSTHESHFRELLLQEKEINLLYSGSTNIKEKQISKILESLNRCQTFVKIVNKKPIGFINYAIFDSKILCFNINRWVGRNGFINLLWVRAENRGYGYGKALLNHAITELKPKTSKILLLTGDANNNARKLYERAGFLLKVSYQEKRVYEMQNK